MSYSNIQNELPGSLTPNHQQPHHRIDGLGWCAIESDPKDLFRLGRCENFSIRSIEAARKGGRWFDYAADQSGPYNNPLSCTFLELTHIDGRGWVLSLELDALGDMSFTLYECRTKTRGAWYKPATDKQSVAFDKLIQRHRAAWETAENVAA